MLAPISWRALPRHYGPWEQVTSLLTEPLVARGVDVTLFATKDSRTAAKLDAICPAPYSEDPAIDAKVWEMLHVAHVFEKAGEFDLIHNHVDFVSLAFSRLVATGSRRSAFFPPSRYTTGGPTMARSAKPIAIQTCAMRQRSITVSRWRTFPSIRMAARICFSLAAFTRTRAQPNRSRRHADLDGN
jgi:hypothetical protein